MNEDLGRVKNNIGEHVTNFVKERLASGQRKFAMRELHDYIFQKTQIAPASPDRILRQLRLEGKFDYKVISRSESLYEIISFGEGVKQKDDEVIVDIKVVGPDPDVPGSEPTVQYQFTCIGERKGASVVFKFPQAITCYQEDVVTISWRGK